MRWWHVILLIVILIGIGGTIAIRQLCVGPNGVPTARHKDPVLSADDQAVLRTQLQGLQRHSPGSDHWKHHREHYLRQAIAGGRLALFNALLDEDPGDAAVDHNGKSALMYAAETGNVEVLQELFYLLKGWCGTTWAYRYSGNYCFDGKPYLNRCDNLTNSTFGYTALMYAARAGKSEAVAFLLNAGADPDKRCSFAQFRAAQLAQMNGHGDVVALIEQKKAVRNTFQRLWENSDLLALAVILAGIVLFGMKVRMRILEIRAARRKQEHV